VAILAGTDFGFWGEGYVRLVYAVSMEVIEEGLDKIARWLNSL
jgi:aspartate/methionine/tyrosine aminotransferase